MSLQRLEHWDTRLLNQFLIDNETVPFSYGSSDCCLMAANAIEAMTGVDIANDFRGKYTTARGALRTIKAVTGGTSVADAAAYVAAKHSLISWSTPLLAQRGDLVLIKDGEQLIAGIVHLNGRHAISIGPSGLVRYPLSAVTQAWKV